MLLLGGGRQSKDRYRYRLEQRKIVAKRIIVDQHNTNAPLISPLTKMPFPPYHIGFKKKKHEKRIKAFCWYVCPLDEDGRRDGGWRARNLFVNLKCGASG